MIIDSHLHVWDPTRADYPWLDHEEALNAPFLPPDVRSERVDGFIFVQADAADGAEEAEWVQGLEWPALLGIVAHANVDLPEMLEGDLERLAALPSFVGVRRLLQDEAPHSPAWAGVREGLELLGARSLPFDACVRHGQLPELIGLVESALEVTVVIDHLGKPPVASGLDSPDGARWHTHMQELATAPRVFAKLSGLAPEADPLRPLAPQVIPFMAAAAEVFGPDRLLFGSDFPVSGATAHRLGYDEWVATVEHALSATPDEHDRIFRRNTERVYLRRTP